MRNGADTRSSDRFRLERAELNVVLNSEAFSRTPTLCRFLSYVCERHFEGQDDQVREYNVAVEALGRPASFDSENDSVVRVEAYRLRKRLSRYYQTEGVDRPLEIVIPAGRYLPSFVQRKVVNGAPSAELGLKSESVEPEVEPESCQESAGGNRAGIVAPSKPEDPATAFLRPSLARTAVAAACVLVVGLALAQVFGMLPDGVNPVANAELLPAAPLLPGAEGAAIRILAGSWDYPYADMEGRIWVGDRFFSGGQEFLTAGERLRGGWDDHVFRTHRVGDFRYDIPVEPGSYELSLYFSERVFGPGNPAGKGEVSRLFDISVNGEALLKEFDIIADAGGPNLTSVKVFRNISPADDGFLHLEFRSVRSQASLSAIELKPMTGGGIAPIRIMAGRSAFYYDADGRTWGPDRYFDGGQTIARLNTVTGGATDRNLYTAERYGNFTYTFPVAQGSYKLTLGFAETWWGESNPGGGGVGSRVFNIYCNGAILLENFDILAETGGANRVIEKAFRDVKPNAQGKIVLSFVPVENYACINWIALEDETPPNYLTSATPHSPIR